MSIGTAKPTLEERQGIRHYFIDSLSIHQPYSAGDFEREALALLEELFREKDLVVVAGGSGLFIQALCFGMDYFPEIPPEIRQYWEGQSLEALQKKILEVDPDYASEVDMENPYRLKRALSVWEASGQPFSAFRQKKPVPRSFTPIYILLEWERSALYARIDARVEKMMQNGLLKEATELFPLRHLPALQTVGYTELFDYFEEKSSLAQAVEKIQQHSRNYAKRQITWFRKYGDWKAFHPDHLEEMEQYIRDSSKSH